VAKADAVIEDFNQSIDHDRVRVLDDGIDRVFDRVVDLILFLLGQLATFCYLIF
jgi:hypothetical protein